MGLCTSCFRSKRRRRVRNSTSNSNSGSNFGYDDERRPLLGAAAEANARERYYEYETRWTNTVQALQKGKLPSEQQLNRALKSTLKVLDAIGVDGDYRGGMSEPGRKVMVDLREVIEAVMMWGIEKNYDSRLQTIVHNVRLLSQAQGRPENDYLSAIRLLLTSAAFRMLISNVLLLFTRHVTNRVSSVAQNVEAAAENIENVVHSVESAMEKVDTIVHGVDKVAEGFEVSAQTTLDAMTLAIDGQTNDAMRTVGEGMDRIAKGSDELASETRPVEARESNEPDEAERREVVIETLREILLAAHRDHPEHIVAARSILTICDNFMKDATPKTSTSALDAPSDLQVKVPPEIPPSLQLFSVPSSSKTRSQAQSADQLLKAAIANLKELLQRLAGGKSFDGVIEAFRQVVEDLKEDQARADGEAEVHVDASEGRPREATKCTEEKNSDVDLIKSSIAVLRQAIDEPAYVERSSHDSKSVFTTDMDSLLEHWASAAQERQQTDSDDDHSRPTSTPVPLPQRQQNHLRTFILQLSSFLTSLENDKPTIRLIDAFKVLETDFLNYFSETSVAGLGSSVTHLGAHYLRFIADVVGHVLPRIIGHALSPSGSSSAFALPLPLPRVEVKTPSLECVADMRGMVVNADVERRRPKRWWQFWDSEIEDEEEYWWGDQRRRSAARETSWNDAPSESVLEDSMYSTITPASSIFGGELRENNWFADFLTPRSVSVKRSEEVVIDFSLEEGVVGREDERSPLVDSSAGSRKRYDKRRSIGTSTSTTSRAHVKMDGLFVGLPISTTSSRRRKTRIVSFENISYYVNYTLWRLLGYQDEGILDLDVTLNGTEDGEEGGVVDMDIEVNFGTAVQQGERGLKILSLALSLPRNIHLDVSCSSYRHPLLTSSVLNPIIIPLSQHIARAETERFAGETLRTILEEGGNRILDLSGMFRKENENGEGDKAWWWKLFVGSSPSPPEGGRDNNGESSTRTDVDVGLTGIDVKVSEENASASAPSSPQLEIAVGVTPQIIPSEAEPQAPVPVDKVVGNVAEEVVAQTSSKAVEDAAIVTGTVKGILKGVNGTAGRKRRQVRYQEGSDEGDKESQLERQRGGWRSDVFDW